MTFLLRQIAFTADHREIVRTTRIERDSVTIGRGAENDIALPDLAVDPRHARIDRRDDRHVVAMALGTLGFEIDGRTVQRGDIDAAKGAELRFGGHRITVTRDGDGYVVLTVERVATVSDTAGERDEAAAFSLRGLVPGKRGTAWLLAAAVLLGFLALPVWGYLHREDTSSIHALKADRSWSSGPLSQAHHQLEGKCESCHVKAFVSVRDDSCRACHKDVHDHAPPMRLASARAAPDLTGRMLAAVARAFGKPGAGCVDCHSEHEGAGPMPPTPQAFCADCHGGLKARLPDTRIADAADFGTAHPQFQPVIAAVPGKHPTLTRASLDGQPTERNGLKFPHKLHLDTRGGVARMAQTLQARNGFGTSLVCADCHKPTADGVRFLPVAMEQSCQMCHSLGFDRVGGTIRTLRHGDVPQLIADLRATYRTGVSSAPGDSARRRPGSYAPGQVYHATFGGRPATAEAAIRAVFTRNGACFDCHVVTPPGATADWSVLPVRQPMRYMLNGWFDHAAHRTEKCESCHAAAQSAFASDVLLPGIKTCRTCHAGEGASAKVPSSCAMCHSYHADAGAPWMPSKTRARIRSLPVAVPAAGSP